MIILKPKMLEVNSVMLISGQGGFRRVKHLGLFKTDINIRDLENIIEKYAQTLLLTSASGETRLHAMVKLVYEGVIFETLEEFTVALLSDTIEDLNTASGFNYDYRPTK